MKPIQLLSFLIIITLSCCSKSNDNLTFTEVDYATSSHVKYSPFMGLPMFMNEVGNKLVISDFFGDSLLIIANVENGHHLRIAPKGNGPQEFQSPLFTSKTDSSILVFNKGRFELGYFLTKDLLADNSTWHKLLDVPSNLSNIYPISKNSFLSSGYFEGYRYAILNGDGEISKYFGDFPTNFASESSFPSDAKAMFHQSFFQKHPEKNIIASVSSHIIELIEPDHPNIIKRIQIADYEYSYSSGERLSTKLLENYPKGVVSSCSDDKYLYFLFNPSTGKNKNERNKIYVVDWNLNPIKKIIPDINFSLIAIRDNGEMIGIANNPEPTIYKLDLNAN